MAAISGQGSEVGVGDAFAAYLEAEGWDVRRQVKYVDVVATKDGITLKAEVRGRTGPSQGLDTDTMFGQILRRFPEQPDEKFTAAVDVPAVSASVGRRVPGWVLGRLGIMVYTVDTTGRVEMVPTDSRRHSSSAETGSASSVSMVFDRRSR